MLKTARIVYKNLVYRNNMKVEEDLGYMELEDIKKIAKERRIKLIIEQILKRLCKNNSLILFTE